MSKLVLKKVWDHHDGVQMHTFPIGTRIVPQGEDMPSDGGVRVSDSQFAFLSKDKYLESDGTEDDKKTHIVAGLHELQGIESKLDTPVPEEEPVRQEVDVDAMPKSFEKLDELQELVTDKKTPPVDPTESTAMPGQDIEAITEKNAARTVETDYDLQRELRASDNVASRNATFDNLIEPLSDEDKKIAQFIRFMEVNEKTMTVTGKPDALYLREQLGFKVSASQRDRVWDFIQEFVENENIGNESKDITA